jgi:DNA-binding transcriptional ArsR family regulator
MSKVTLNRETFKALASETRLDILHALDARRKTGSEMARELELNKATVHEHLQTLAAAGLVTKKDEGRKWVYWELSWEGSKLMNPGQGAVFSVLLGLAVLATGGGITALGATLGWWFDSMGARGKTEGTSFSPPDEDADAADDSAEPQDGGAETAPGEGANESAMAPAPEAEASDLPDAASDSNFGELGISAIMLLFTALVCLAMAIWLRRRR